MPPKFVPPEVLKRLLHCSPDPPETPPPSPPKSARTQLKFNLDAEHAQAQAVFKEAERALSKAAKAAEKQRREIAEDFRAGDRRVGESSPCRKSSSLLSPSHAGSPKAASVASPSRAMGPKSASLGASLASPSRPTGFKDSDGATRSCRDFSRENATSTRAVTQRNTGLDMTVRLSDHGKRAVRSKVASLIAEVRKRLELHKHQESRRTFRERRYLTGMGPFVDTGDHDAFALGLDGIVDDPRADIDFHTAVCVGVLDGLSTHEMTLVRGDPRFFFGGQAVELALGADGGAERQAQSSSRQQQIVDLFTAWRDKHIPIEDYERRLRAQLAARNKHALAQTAASVLLDNRPGGSTDESSGDNLKASSKSEPPPEPLGRMPCLGRRRAVRNDFASPTLAKVREVVGKREEADRKLAEERCERLSKHAAQNTIRVQEQQHLVNRKIASTRELHKWRLQEAIERKATDEATQEEQLKILAATASQRDAAAQQRTEEIFDNKRKKTQKTLEKWEEVVWRGQDNWREKEAAELKKAEARWTDYTVHIWKIGVAKHCHFEKVDEKKNEADKLGAHNELRARIGEEREAKRLETQETLAKRLDGANQRRQSHGKGYNLLDRAANPGGQERLDRLMPRKFVREETPLHSFSEPNLHLLRELAPPP